MTVRVFFIGSATQNLHRMLTLGNCRVIVKREYEPRDNKRGDSPG